jgi:pilus assembly protein FimV
MTHQASLRFTANNNKLTKRIMPWHVMAMALACFVSPLLAQAYTVGHAKVTSVSGQPLVVTIPLRNLTPNDLTQISANVSSPSQWQSAGLKPPVTIESISVEILPAVVNDPSQRLLKISSTESAQGVVVDLLLEVVTPSGVKPVQASIIVLPAPVVATPGGQFFDVQRGDTLWSIAQKYPTAGANIYQSLLALFQANPNAFIDQNMNLLRTGATLKLPTAADVLAINAGLAQRIFNQQLQAFNAMRGGRVTPSAQTLSAAPSQSMSKGQIDTPVEKQIDSGNEVRLASPDLGTQQADQSTSAARQARDENARIQALQGNIAALGSAANGSAANGSAASGSAANGSAASGSAANGSAANGSAANGSAASGSASGSASNGSTSGSASNSSTTIGSASNLNAAGANSVAQNAQGTDNQGASVTATKPATNQVGSASSTEGQVDGVSSIETTFNTIRLWLVENTFIAAIILLAIITWLIALFMKNASSRRAEDQLESANGASDLQQQAFSEKLGSIDLNLNDDSKETEKKN